MVNTFALYKLVTVIHIEYISDLFLFHIVIYKNVLVYNYECVTLLILV